MPRRGLPDSVTMRHDEHYVEALAASAGMPIGRLVPIDQIDPNPNQPRQVMGDLSELIASITEKGVIEPLVVRQRGERFQIIAGEQMQLRPWARKPDLTHQRPLIADLLVSGRFPDLNARDFVIQDDPPATSKIALPAKAVAISKRVIRAPARLHRRCELNRTIDERFVTALRRIQVRVRDVKEPAAPSCAVAQQVGIEADRCLIGGTEANPQSF